MIVGFSMFYFHFTKQKEMLHLVTILMYIAEVKVTDYKVLA